jgi:hypothetical protein
MDLVQKIFSRVIVIIARGITIGRILKLMRLPGTQRPGFFHRDVFPKREIHLDCRIHTLPQILLLKSDIEIQAKALKRRCPPLNATSNPLPPLNATNNAPPAPPANASSMNSSPLNNRLCPPHKPASQPSSSHCELKIARRGSGEFRRIYVGCWIGMRILRICTSGS